MFFSLYVFLQRQWMLLWIHIFVLHVRTHHKTWWFHKTPEVNISEITSDYLIRRSISLECLLGANIFLITLFSNNGREFLSWSVSEQFSHQKRFWVVPPIHGSWPTWKRRLPRSSILCLVCARSNKFCVLFDHKDRLLLLSYLDRSISSAVCLLGIFFRHLRQSKEQPELFQVVWFPTSNVDKIYWKTLVSGSLQTSLDVELC